MQLIQSDGMGDWRQINEAGPKYQAVTAADLRRVSNKYFKRSESHRRHLHPQGRQGRRQKAVGRGQ